MSPVEAIDTTDQDVDLAHAENLADSNVHGAAIHLCEEGNHTTLRIRVCIPVGISFPDTMPTPTA